MSKLTFTLVQSVLHWEDKEANLSMFTDKISGIQDSHVIVLPEMFNTGFSMKPEPLAENMEGRTLRWMRKTAAEKKMIVTGSMMIEDEGRFFNRLIWMLPNGQLGFYDKRHLFAYAGEDRHYTKGSGRLIASVNGWKVFLLVCYDLRFPVWSRQSSEIQQGTPAGTSKIPEYDVLVYVANWPEKRRTAWTSLLQARAIENQCYVIGVNRVGTDGNGIEYSGYSMVVDPLGEILYQKPLEEDVYSITLDREHLAQVRERFPFWKDADSFEIFA